MDGWKQLYEQLAGLEKVSPLEPGPLRPTHERAPLPGTSREEDQVTSTTLTTKRTHQPFFGETRLSHLARRSTVSWVVAPPESRSKGIKGCLLRPNLAFLFRYSL
jgi:hypothetical protein